MMVLASVYLIIRNLTCNLAQQALRFRSDSSDNRLSLICLLACYITLSCVANTPCTNINVKKPILLLCTLLLLENYLSHSSISFYFEANQCGRGKRVAMYLLTTALQILVRSDSDQKHSYTALTVRKTERLLMLNMIFVTANVFNAFQKAKFSEVMSHVKKSS